MPIQRASFEIKRVSKGLGTPNADFGLKSHLALIWTHTNITIPCYKIEP